MPLIILPCETQLRLVPEILINLIFTNINKISCSQILITSCPSINGFSEFLWF